MNRKTLKLEPPKAYRRRKDNAGKSRYGESLVEEKMKAAGIKFNWTGNTTKKGTPDFITESGKRLDVKISTRRSKKNKKKKPLGYWFFNLHHHGEIQKNIDFFIFVLREKGLVFVISYQFITWGVFEDKPKITFRISERQLKTGRYDLFLENWKPLL